MYENIITDQKNYLNQILLYENERYMYDTNRMISLSTIKFCIGSKRFDLSLFKAKTVRLSKQTDFSLFSD